MNSRFQGAPALRVISLGAGVQSSVMALMATDGAVGDMPDVAIFADTGWEPPAIYDHVDWLEGQLAFPVRRVQARSLKDDAYHVVNERGGRHFTNLPLFLRFADGGKGMLRRGCTRWYKIVPIERDIRRLLGVNRVTAPMWVEQWLGISTDEAQRMTDNPTPWVSNRYPLVERGMNRQTCVDWFAEHYPGRALVKSACMGCPFQSRARWIEFRRSNPPAYAEAVETDRLQRHLLTGKLHGTVYLHENRLPLDEAIDLDERRMAMNPRLFDIDHFGNECEGHCGV